MSATKESENERDRVKLRTGLMAVAVTRMLTSPGPTGAKERSETVCRLNGAGMTAALKDAGTADIFLIVFGSLLKVL